MGFICGLGAATADALYAGMGAFALTSVSLWLIRGRVWMTVVGGSFLVYLGAMTFIAAPPGAAANAAAAATDEKSGVAITAYFSTLLLTFANPLTILSFAAAFAGISSGDDSFAVGGYTVTVTMLLGVFGGSVLWWLLLSAVAGRAGRHLGPAALAAINRVSGAILVGFGAYTLATLAGQGPKPI